MAHLPHTHGPVLIKLIAIDKLLKGAVLLVLGFQLLRLWGPDAQETLHRWVHLLRLDPDNRYIHALIEKITGISQSQLHVLSVGTFIYSALYFTEGVGLLFDALWAEWLTVISTAGFIPVEIYEIFHRFTWIKTGVFLLNVLILIYLVLRLIKRHAEHRKRREAAGFPVNPPLS